MPPSPWHDLPVLRQLVLLAAVSATLACAASARAHEGGQHTGFAARVSVIEPFIPGLLVQVIGGHERMSVANLTDQSIVILDERGDPFVRIGPGKTETWAEPRIGATEEPPEEEGLVRNWRIRGTADGEPFQIRGFLGYRPPPGSAEEERSGLTALAIVLGVGVLTLGALIAFRLRRGAR
jgi:hypothetical protein